MILRTIISLVLTCACIYLRAQVNIITTIAGNGNQGYLGDGSPATNAEFDHPYQLVLERSYLYIADAFNHRVRKIDLITGIITTVAGTGIPGYNGDSIEATDAQLLVPEGLCVDSVGNIYIADGGNYRVRKVDIVTGIITTIAGNGSVGHSGDGGLATSAQINPPGGLSFDKEENLFFAEGNFVRKVTPSGLIYTVAGNGTMGYSGDHGPATNAELNLPNKVTVDNFENLIISDGRNYVVRKVDAASGTITTIAGNGNSGYSGDNGPATNAVLGGSSGGFVDKENNFFFADGFNGVIRKIDGTTGYITTVVGDGIQGFSGDGGPATNAKLKPTDVCLDSFGTIYIADMFNYRIRKVYNPKLGVANQNAVNEKVNIYPNPTQNTLTIAYSFANSGEGIFQITDITGRVVAAKNLRSQKQEEEINVSNLSAGLYLYKVLQNNILISTGKIIKE